MKGKKNWIAEATSKNKGSLRKAMGAKKGQTIPKGKLKTAAAKGGKMGKKANLAITLGKLRGK